MVDNLDLESRAKAYGFESLRPDQRIVPLSSPGFLGSLRKSLGGWQLHQNINKLGEIPRNSAAGFPPGWWSSAPAGSVWNWGQIVMQVEELQKRMREIGTYIVDGRLNNTAFYESQPLYTTDYWDQYKHQFTRRMDAFSFSTFDDFYNCAAAVLEQQQLMKILFISMKHICLIKYQINQNWKF